MTEFMHSRREAACRSAGECIAAMHTGHNTANKETNHEIVPCASA